MAKDDKKQETITQQGTIANLAGNNKLTPTSPAFTVLGNKADGSRFGKRFPNQAMLDQWLATSGESAGAMFDQVITS
jgi:hypothetical protein